MSHNVIIGIVVLLIVLSIIFQIMIGVLYQNMINETDNMTATDNLLLKQCKKKFANCYRMNGGVTNIPVFVDKFINHLRIGNISLISLQHWSGQLVLFSVFVSGMGIYIGITRGDRFISLMPYYIISMIGLYVYFGVSSAIDITGKKRVLKTNLVDYMENHMVKRLELLPESMRMADMTEEELGFRKRRSGMLEMKKKAGYYEKVENEDAEDAEDVELTDEDIAADTYEDAELAVVKAKAAKIADKKQMAKSQKDVTGHMGDDELEMLLREFLS